MGLNPVEAMLDLLARPFDIIRLPAYWSLIEPGPAGRHFDALDRQVDAAQHAGKQLILAVGAVKNFGYPEFFVPAHRLPEPLRDGSVIDPEGWPSLLAAAVEFVSAVVERYRDCSRLIAWQVEHEAVDPLGMEHSWRLSRSFVEREIAAVRAADPVRPVLLNGFLAMTGAIRAVQSWRTRGQGDSLALAMTSADIVGVDYYPRFALGRIGSTTLYMDAGREAWRSAQGRGVLSAGRQGGRRIMVSEGQAEPWETAVIPEARADHFPYSCTPEQLIRNYTDCIDACGAAETALEAYLFWGAEYWLARRRNGDSSYLEAFERVLAESAARPS